MTVSAANRGKDGEKEVEKQLKRLTVLSNFDYERVPDAYSTRGGLQGERPGDFAAYYDNKTYLIEVKEVAHAFRLPKPNFKKAQRARLRKRQLCGVVCYVVVYHSPTKLFRILPIDYFDSEETGSWDLQDQPLYQLNQLLQTIFPTCPQNFVS